ncbi:MULTISPECIES: hypothetical protein [unclassified Streptomyces]|uniref:hypothetical protein n=1 Tax=unclassified Streptomyces TaxID=2593676 RepID=UPI000823E4BC|nr:MULTISPECIES: hypothetical protein [unclassified Streptomyces]MYU02095.1 hypothetical protein [Streptomyces sp. SID8350]SCK61529.1 hypothetical protein YUWDRAFT_06157 [Streptomyces sp. AmelKG-D3]
MKTCARFERIKSGYERDITYLRNHSQRSAGTTAAKTSATNALAVKSRMAKALGRHFERCPICG